MSKILTLATKLKKARQDAGLSQKELGHALQLSDKAVSSYEVGRSEPSLEVLKQISSLVHRPLQYFVDDQDEVEADIQARMAKIEHELQELRKLLQKKG